MEFSKFSSKGKTNQINFLGLQPMSNLLRIRADFNHFVFALVKNFPP